MGNKNGGNANPQAGDNQTARREPNEPASPGDRPKSDSTAKKKATPSDRSDSLQRDPNGDKLVKDPTGFEFIPDKNGTHRAENNANSADGAKSKSGEMNKGEASKSRDPAPQTSPARIVARVQATTNRQAKPSDSQPKNKPGDKTTSPDEW